MESFRKVRFTNLHGKYVLVKLKKRDVKRRQQKAWLLMKLEG